MKAWGDECDRQKNPGLSQGMSINIIYCQITKFLIVDVGINKKQNPNPTTKQSSKTRDALWASLLSLIMLPIHLLYTTLSPFGEATDGAGD